MYLVVGQQRHDGACDFVFVVGLSVVWVASRVDLTVVTPPVGLKDLRWMPASLLFGDG